MRKISLCKISNRQFYILAGTFNFCYVMTRLNSALFLIFIGLLSFILHPAAAEPSVYKVFVDGSGNDGFKVVRIIEPKSTTFKYENLTLKLNAGDSVIWESQDYYDWPLTIVSEQNLWDTKSGYLRYSYTSFNYTFMQPGTYGVYIKEYPRVPHQTIIVAAMETPTVTTPPPTPTETETAAPTASVAQTPPGALPGFNPWYILLAFIVVAGIVLFIYSLKKK
jgi:plastocyanin